ncbi:hypothetical protein [Limnospira fusiformis]|uniref:hypothetical protein n=1 Tax=Limnospira fusiformis TaxID=54297 RepID=UPI0014499811|nr:hypothetical protein HFV01_05430 [Limnospira fusiformis SAG 85.79]
MEQNYPENLDLNLLQDYYQALDAINTQHLKLLDAQRELSWHNSRKQEAYRLAEGFGFDDVSSLLSKIDCNYVSGENTDRERINKTLNEINISLEKIRDTKQKKYLEIESIKAEKQSKLQSLIDEKIKISQELDNIERKIEDLKNKKMFRLISTVIVALWVTIIWQEIYTTLLVTSIYLLIILSAI